MKQGQTRPCGVPWWLVVAVIVKWMRSLVVLSVSIPDSACAAASVWAATFWVATVMPVMKDFADPVSWRLVKSTLGTGEWWLGSLNSTGC